MFLQMVVAGFEARFMGPIVACFTAMYVLLIVLILWNVDVCVQLY